MSNSGYYRNAANSATTRRFVRGGSWGLPPSNPSRVSEEYAYPNRDYTGTVFKFYDDRQFGFAEFEGFYQDGRGSRGVFVHNKEVTSPPGIKLRKGSRIRANITKTDKGPRAVNIRIIS